MYPQVGAPMPVVIDQRPVDTSISFGNIIGDSTKNKLYAPDTSGCGSAATGDLSPTSGNQVIQ